MSDAIRFKVCGIRRAEDAQAAAAAGASWLGFNLFPGSPRYLALSDYTSLASELPTGLRVAVMVEPTPEEIRAAINAGFDFFQIHFRLGEKGVSPRGYAEQVTPERLWLAPKLPPGANFPAGLLSAARTFLLDTFQPEGFGGSGKTGDWEKFARHQQAHPESTWILAGGLNPQNVGEAIRRSGARIVDVNSGVESSPGVKDTAKLEAFAAALQGIG